MYIQLGLTLTKGLKPCSCHVLMSVEGFLFNITAFCFQKPWYYTYNVKSEHWHKSEAERKTDWTKTWIMTKLRKTIIIWSQRIDFPDFWPDCKGNSACGGRQIFFSVWILKVKNLAWRHYQWNENKRTNKQTQKKTQKTQKLLMCFHFMFCYI